MGLFSKKYGIGLVFFLLVGAFGTEALRAQDTPPAKPAQAGGQPDKKAGESAATLSIDSLTQQAIAQLKAQLDAQNKQIEALQAQYSTEVESRQQEVEKQRQLVSDQAKQIDTQRQAMQSLQQQVDQMAAVDPTQLSAREKELRSRLETVEGSIQASQKAEATQYDINSFPGSIPIPGSSAAIRFGGFVKMNVVESFDPIGTSDRFIVGTIPVPEDSGPAEAALTVSQSRLNLDLRDTTQAGPLRAFIEGDFAGTGDTFRLRHAFGQYEDLLIGKTWSTFMDFEAMPEDLDFEGINGQILLRQPQIRYFPSIGKNWNLLIAAEDPDPEISGGKGISQIPDIVLSVRRTWFEKWHVKTALLLRQIEGTCDCLDNPTDKESGWALSVSGKTALPWWDERDNFLFQMSVGDGYGRYVNDLGTIGRQDAVFDPVTGKLSALPVLAYYVALQKWWAATLRSNFNYGYVDIDNTDFQQPDAYNKTRRASGNIIWSPTARVDLGAELLWGERQNKDDQKGKATQLQVSATYRY